MRLIFLLLAVMAIAGCDTQKAQKQQGAAGNEAAATADSGFSKGLDRSRKGSPLPDVQLIDADHDPGALSELKGEPILVNLWASWCIPCVKELPTLQALGKQAGMPSVVAVSQDMGPRSSVDAFVKQHKLDELEVWQDSKMELSDALGVQVLPTSILYDAEGKEVWRYTGDLDWTGAEAAKLLAEVKAPAKS
ncbi:MAG: TlpA family protein disulfide reductase [Sphingomicrobium sp.]